MPLYEYRCQGCGEISEVLQRMDDAPLSECPRCGGVLSKIASAPALQFKGSGWYVTDYGRAGKKDAGAATAAASEAAPKPPADPKPSPPTST
ncbi:MAG: hypothetical protein MUF10_07920 [Thermoanaerobaculaceae bacterium]|jgi:putative FmdB family regulatory protein|nr:hypothetical protein [Thermoanaerobaculaceae bacterium]